MKKQIKSVTILVIVMILFGITSCAVGLRTDNGRHRGWFHNRHRDAVIIIDKEIDKDNHHRHSDESDRR